MLESLWQNLLHTPRQRRSEPTRIDMLHEVDPIHSYLSDNLSPDILDTSDNHYDNHFPIADALPSPDIDIKQSVRFDEPISNPSSDVRQSGRSDGPNGSALSVDSKLYSNDRGFAQVLELISEQLKSQTEINRELVQSKADKDDDNVGSLPKSVIKAIIRGEYVSALALYDDDIARMRCSNAPFAQREFKRPTRVDEMDFYDYTMCLMRLARLYHEHGQANLGFQVYNLVHIAMTESATKTRISIIRACERLRRYYTSPICKWENDSLYKVDIRSLLEPITRRPARRSTKSSDISRKRKFTSPSDRTTDDSSNMCSYWEAGRPCKFEPHCRYRHTCIACGKMDIHDPKVCKLRAVTSKLQRS